MKTLLKLQFSILWLFAVFAAGAQTNPEFWPDATTGIAPFTVNFSDNITTDGTKEWDFDGDGTTDAKGDNPQFIYEKPGQYSVTLTIADASVPVNITKESLITALDGSIPEFWADKTTGPGPLTVQFSSTLPAASTQYWDLDGDGTDDFSGPNPQFTYTEDGDYTVVLVYDIGNGKEEIVKNMYIHVGEQNPVEDFWITPNTGMAPLTVSINDNFQNAISKSWDFDGDYNIDVKGDNPSFTYDRPGTYMVVLFIDQGNGEYMIERPSAVTVLDQSVPDFWADITSGPAPLTVNFNSTLPATYKLVWDLDGDGTDDSDLLSPQFTYKDPGTYTVVLNYTDATTQTIKKEMYIRVEETPVQDFWADKTSGPSPFTVNFSDNIAATAMLSWDFDGDGKEDATGHNPTFTYQEPGMYTVILKTDDGNGTNEIIKKDFIDVYNDNRPDFVAQQTFGYAPFWVQFSANIPAEVTNFAWDFENDGTIDIENEYYPEYVYEKPGSYSVALHYKTDAGEDVIIKDNFIIVEDGIGRMCENPISAVNGENQFYSKDGSSMYYSYTATMDGIIILSSCGMTDQGTWAHVMHSCYNDDASYQEYDCGDQTQMVIQAQKGEKFIIEWNAYDSQGSTQTEFNFLWTLKERLLQPGEVCNKPASAIEGTNIANIWGATEGTWFTYIAKRDGILTVSNCDQTTEDTELLVFKDSCFGPLIAYSDDECGLQSTAQFDCKIGQTYYIWWQLADNLQQSSFKWDLSLVEGSLPPGSSCDNPVFLKEGENIVELKNNLNWFEYTAQTEGKIIFDFSSSINLADEEIGLLMNCMVGEGQDQYLRYDGTNFYAWAFKGQTFNMYWLSDPSITRAESIIIKESPQLVPEGIYCKKPITAKEGTNIAASSKKMQWFAYTASADGFIEISNCGMTTAYTRLAVFNSCTTIPYMEDYGSCDGQSKIISEVKKGQNLLIAWQSEFPTDFKWNIKLSPYNDVTLHDIWFEEQADQPSIDETARTITITVGANALFENLAPHIAIPFGAEAYLNDMYYEPEFINTYPLNDKNTLTIYAADGISKDEWTLYIEKKELASSAADILDFNIPELNISAAISEPNILIQLPYIQNSCFPIAIRTSPLSYAKTSYGEEIYTDFYYCFINDGIDSILVTAEDGTEKWWYVQSSMEEAPIGAECAKPLAAIEGENNGIYINGSVWFQYTATKDAFVGITSNSNDMDIYGYYDICYSNNQFQGYATIDQEAVFPVKAGQKMLFQCMDSYFQQGVEQKYSFNLYLTVPRNGTDIEWIEPVNVEIVDQKYDYDNGVVQLIVPYATNLENAGLRLELSEGAFGTINSEPIEDELYLDLTTEQTIIVIAENGDKKTWSIQAERISANTKANIETITFIEQLSQPVINSTDGIVYVTVDQTTDRSAMTAYIQPSIGAEIQTVTGEVFLSGKTVLDYTTPVELILTAENGTKKTWSIVVTPKTDTEVPVESVFFTEKEYFIEIEQSKTVKAYVTPSNATNQNVSYSTETPEIVSITNAGIVTARKIGTAIITATDATGKFTAKANVIVTPPSLKQIEVVPASIQLVTNDVHKLQVKYYPELTIDTIVKWEVKDMSIAKIDEQGNVTGLAPGATSVFAYSASNPDISSMSIIDVVEKEIMLEAIKTLKERVYMTGGSLYQINPVFTPEDATYKGLLYKSNKPEVIAVDMYGTVRASNVLDTAIVTIQSAKYPEIATSLEIIVDKVADIPIESIAIPATFSLPVNTTRWIKPDIQPASATNKALSWVSLSPAIVSVESNGAITGLQEGEAILFAISKDGNATASNECMVTVTSIAIKEITVNVLDVLNLEIGAIETGVKAFINPVEASGSALLWKSADKTIAMVDSLTGVIAAKGLGETTITVASAQNPDISASFTVVVKPRKLDFGKLKMAIDETNQFLGYVEENDLIGPLPGQYPALAIGTLQSVLDQSIALLDTAKTQLAVDTRAEILFQALTAAKNSINGKIDITSLTLNLHEITIALEKKSFLLKTEILPSNATNRSLKWVSENSGIVNVTSIGEVMLLNTGSTKIFAKATDGSGLIDSCIVHVIAPVTDIILPESIGVEIGTSVNLEAGVIPENATDQSLVWKSDNDKIATVDQNGNITAVNLGTCKITVASEKHAISAMTMITVVEKTIPVTGIDLPEQLNMAVGAQLPIKAMVHPYNATNKKIAWNSESPLTAKVDRYGIVTAISPGTLYIYAVTEDGGFIDSTKLVIIPSLKPEILSEPKFTILQGLDSISFALHEFVTDDNTNFENLKFNPTVLAGFTVNIFGDTVRIKQTSNSSLGLNIIKISVTDRDGLTDTLPISVTVSAETNSAPQIKPIAERTIKKGSDFIPIYLNRFVTDDYTMPENIRWEIEQGTNLYVRVSDQIAQIIILNPEFSGTEVLAFIAFDKGGLSDTIKVSFTISDENNLPPLLLPIPDQVQTETQSFATIDLSEYCIDDYTLPENILWEVLPSGKVTLKLEGTKLSATVLDKTWMGSETVTIIATDEAGATSQTAITYTQKVVIQTDDWSGKPLVDFYADRTTIAVGSAAQFHASISGVADEGWAWTFYNGTPNESSNLDESVVYNTPGSYDVLFKAKNAEGTDSLLIEDYINVFGIKNAPDTICANTMVTIEVSDLSLDSYEWSTGETTPSISVNPEMTTTYRVTATLGLFKLIDSITYTVPEKLNLGKDTVLCSGDQLEISFENYKAVNWDGMGMQTMQKVFYAHEARNYVAEATDSLDCASIDTIAISELLALPSINLGNDRAICLGKSIDIGGDKTDGFQYNWSNGETESMISVDESGTYKLTVTGANTCIAKDSVTITVLEPYAEALGLVTTSQLDDAVIIVWQRTKGKRTKAYKVLRETGSKDEFDTLATIPFGSNSVYFDKTANLKRQAYKYKLLTIDSCDNIAESEPHVTMHLQMNKNLDNSIDLKWKPYLPEDLYKSYVIYRSKPNSTEMDSIASIASTTGTSWTEVEDVRHEAVYRVGVRFENTFYADRLKSDSGPYSQSISNLSEAVVISSTAISQDEDITVYPSPADETVWIVAEDITGSTVSISFVDESGRIVLQKQTENNGSTFAALVDIAHLASGTYTVRVQDAKHCIMQTVIVE